MKVTRLDLPPVDPPVEFTVTLTTQEVNQLRGELYRLSDAFNGIASDEKNVRLIFRLVNDLTIQFPD